MQSDKTLFKEVLPKEGLLYEEDQLSVILCKPKILPLKSVTLEKLEKMQKDAQNKVKEQEMESLGQSESDEQKMNDVIQNSNERFEGIS
ncbi:BBSome-interacting protein 1 [Holothuria leucospilota]|uniref:BBSome-interacting protein 1 n=1 Tax=Holothuria leucospilota TaxID=206669 RepID=A0A9Q0YPX2_HOLLE|nr:BBSome-interacting protein 1 [Holothuria leucospilota]